MSDAISNIRKRGRPAVGATQVNVRFPPDEIAELDRWIKAQPAERTRPDAIRRLVKKAIAKN